jgi:hypothetical protein
MALTMSSKKDSADCSPDGGTGYCQSALCILYDLTSIWYSVHVYTTFQPESENILMKYGVSLDLGILYCVFTVTTICNTFIIARNKRMLT